MRRYFTKQARYNSHRSCRCNAGHQHDSIFEADYCNSLQILEKAGEIESFKIYPRFELKIGETHVCDHYPDFLVFKKDGTSEVHETKGPQGEVWRLKKKLFEACYPDIPYHIILDGRSYDVQKNKKRVTQKDLKRLTQR